MFITVEGPRLSGKTTLVGKLEKELGKVEVFERPCDMKTRVEALDNYVFAHEDYVPGNEQHVLLDGGHLWEATNLEQATKGGYGLLGSAGWRWTEMFLASRGAVTGTLTADNTTLEARTAEIEEEDVDTVKILQYSSRYEFARRESMTVVAIHDGSLGESNEEKYENYVNSLIGDAKYWEDKAAHTLGDFPEYIGSLTPTTLIVDYDKPDAALLPMIPVEESPYEFFFTALPDLFWRGVGVINAASLAEPSELDRLWAALGKPTVIALGSQASTFLEAAEVEFTTVDHPADLPAYDLATAREYGKLIRDIGLNQDPATATIEEPHA